MPCQPIFTPNFSSGPCLYCNGTLESQPEQFLKCELCRRSSHLACLKSGIPETRLLGDNFFVFSCSHCNNNQVELVTRAQMSIAQVLALVLYNLHLSRFEDSDNGYFHYKEHVYNFLVDNWDNIYSYAPSRWYRNKEKTKPHVISGQLAHYPQHFQVNKSGKRGWYKLVYPLPPAQMLYLNQKKNSQGKIQKGEVKKSKNEEMVNAPSLSYSTFLGVNSSRSTSSSSNVASSDSFLRFTQLEDSLENFDDGSSRGSWFTESCIMKPAKQLPKTIFEDEDNTMVKDEANIDVDVMTECENESPLSFSEDEKVEKPIFLTSLFSKSEDTKEEYSTLEQQFTKNNQRLSPLNFYEEGKLLNRLDRINETGQISKELYRLRRKLKVRQIKREHSLSLLDIDEEIDFFNKHGKLMSEKERLSTSIFCKEKNKVSFDSSRILDRFQVTKDDHSSQNLKAKTSFKLKLAGSNNAIDYINSPFTLRKLKPYIYRDTSLKPLKVQLLEEVKRYPHRNDDQWIPPPSSPIDYCYVTPRHIPSINQLARQYFWPGIELSEVLHYPDYTCVVLYGHLVIGFGILVPDIRPNESYISFLLVHPEFRRAGIAKFILYHLIQTSHGKDITLHVSPTNPALTMYQKFGFKVEEFLTDFYDKYLSIDSKECKHAMLMRLTR